MPANENRTKVLFSNAGSCARAFLSISFSIISLSFAYTSFSDDKKNLLFLFIHFLFRLKCYAIRSATLAYHLMGCVWFCSWNERKHTRTHRITNYSNKFTKNLIDSERFWVSYSVKRFPMNAPLIQTTLANISIYSLVDDSNEAKQVTLKMSTCLLKQPNARFRDATQRQQQ